jgi:hypothetical protein
LKKTKQLEKYLQSVVNINPKGLQVSNYMYYICN